jgi:hypothetical protein
VVVVVVVVVVNATSTHTNDQRKKQFKVIGVTTLAGLAVACG